MVTDTESAGRYAAGDALTATNGTWTVNGTATSCGLANHMVCAYQWQHCDTSGANCTSITTGDCFTLCQDTYHLQASDVGHTVRVIVTAGNSIGSTDAMATVVGGGSGVVNRTCDYSATTSANLVTALGSVSNGQTICLTANANYGTFGSGSETTTKTITIMAAPGASPQMALSCRNSCSNFTLIGMTNMSGVIDGPASNVTIMNSVFTGALNVAWDDGTGMTNVDIDQNTFNWNAVSNGTGNAKLALNEVITPTSGTVANPSIIVENNDIENGDLDGVHIGDGSGMVIRNNTFRNLCDLNNNHTDNIQMESGTQILISGNYIYTPGPVSSTACVAGGITALRTQSTTGHH